MQVLRSNRLIDLEYWNVAKETVLNSQRAELADSLFSIPEGVWHSIRWHTDVDVQKANNSEFNVVSTLCLDISDPLDTENMLQEKLNKAYYRLSKVEALCRGMYRVLDKVESNLDALVGQPMRMLTEESAEKTRHDLNCYKERMDALGLLEGWSE